MRHLMMGNYITLHNNKIEVYDPLLSLETVYV